MRYMTQSLSAFLSTIVLVACSGGDGGSTAPLPNPSGMAKIDASSAEPISRRAVEAVFLSGRVSDVLWGGGSGYLVGAAEVQSAKPMDSKSSDLLGYFMNLSTADSTTPCAVDGSVTVSGEVADPSTLSASDRILLQFSDCDDGAGRVLNGIYQVDINSFSGDLSLGLLHLNAAVTLDGFDITERQEKTSLAGGVTLDLDTTMPPTTKISVSGDSLSISDSTDAATLTLFRIDETHDAGVAPEAYTSAAIGTLSSTLFEGAVNFSTPIPFIGFAGEYPFTGELSVAGADGSSLNLFALDNANVRLEINSGDGSGVASEVTTWAQLASPLVTIETGIRGQVIRGPIHPGPEIEGVSNEEPFSASFSVLNSEDTRVAGFKSDENGIFEVFLRPGEYTVVPDPSAPILFPEQQTKAVSVPRDGFADVILEFDTGIR